MTKLHNDYAKYLAGGGKALAPQGRQFKAYAEGYNAKTAGALITTNPHPAWQVGDQSSDYAAWNNGWQDKNSGYPPTHVGGINVVALSTEAEWIGWGNDPEPEQEETPIEEAYPFDAGDDPPPRDDL